MAHGFINLGQNSTFATRKELAWHGLGSVVESMTAKEAMVLGGLDFEVGLAPLYAEIKPAIESPAGIWGWKGNHFKNVSTNFATYRKDTNDIFGVVGSRYEPVQNTEAFAFFDSVIGEGHAEYETVGALGNGERVFITAKLPSHLHVGKDTIDKYLLLTMAHDGSGAVNVLFTPVRVVCNNTLSLALNRATNKVSIRHTKNALNRLEDAKKILGIAEKNFETLEQYFNRLSHLKITDEDAQNIFKTSFNLIPQEDGKLSTRAKNKLTAVTNYYNIGVGQENIIGTGWGVYNAVTGYLQNGLEREGDKQFTSTFIKGDEVIRSRTSSALLARLEWS